MHYELYIEHHAEKDLKKISDSPLFSEIMSKIKELQVNPHPQGSKKIKSTQNDWRLRIQEMRPIMLIPIHWVSGSSSEVVSFFQF